MPNAAQKGKRQVKSKSQGTDQRAVHRMAVLASQLGFTSPQILQMTRQSPDRQLALAALLGARERDNYRYHSIESLVDRMVELFEEAIPTDSLPSYRERAFPTIPRRQRCGKPCMEAHEQEKKFLFFDYIEGPSSDNEVSALFGVDSMDNAAAQEVVAELSPEDVAERIIDEKDRPDQPGQGAAVSPSFHQDNDVSVEEADTLPELPSDDRIANHRLTLGPRKKQMAGQHPLTNTAASKRQTAERTRLAAADAPPAKSPIFAENRGTQLDVDQIPGSTE
ncbi:hypothetical protein PISL3812_06921 [Talaromyces islandicus]|uniref:Uncharacterized protein n=1 Tax=Talaromyces islandicus TaxID=28573 RepID=A0A0U1M3C1_TALIS|nr:hypothetical protein PISL3812_06921 [Talaromyces islandicus]